MLVGINIAVTLDLPAWALAYLPGNEHWHVAWCWVDLSLKLVCY
ncbi:hypothetical protein [Parahaliea maris]|nr:hypothetical protein [Parahaliea maris]